MIYQKIQYINWKNEAKIIVLPNDEMVAKVKEIKATRSLAKSKTKRAEFDEKHYGLDRQGDYLSLYVFENNQYVIYKNNMLDNNKNISTGIKRADRIFDEKFKELNNISVRKAFGFSDKTLKRCIPKQFYYVNKDFVNIHFIGSSIDASSQYPSGCLGRLPDFHNKILVHGRAKPNEEYPFAFYASGHCAEYGVFDTHDWMLSKYALNLFRFGRDEDWPLRSLTDDQEETILVKASDYTMDSTWMYFYNNKSNCIKDSDSYNEAKLIMNKTIGCWHRKDKNKKSIMCYDDHGSYQLAHIVAIAIARGNQKILNMVDKIGKYSIAHICVDGIIYGGDDVMGIPESRIGVFKQEFTGADILLLGINLYCAKMGTQCVKFKHAGFDLLDGQEIDENRNFDFDDLNRLSCKEHTIELWEEN